MYLNYFGLAESPFSIAPDPQYLYMSARHREAMAHLSYGLSQGGCFIVLTGEVGTGKTTLCRNLLADLPDNVDVALILNPSINRRELLETVCDELKIDCSEHQSKKKMLDSINEYLLAAYAENRHTVLIVDEAQLLSRAVLEQVRLLTNLETNKSKLLQIILIGQPELNDVLSRNDLRQLAQRVTARYHLSALAKDEIQDYVNFRLGVAGCKKPLFSAQALKRLHQLSGGIPRKINVLADHALLATYAKSQPIVDSKTVKKSADEVFISSSVQSATLSSASNFAWPLLIAAFMVLNVGLWWWFMGDSSQVVPVNQTPTQNLGADSGPALSGASTEGATETSAQNQNESLIDLSKLPESAGVVTTIIKPEGVSPGSVVIADEYLEPAEQAVFNSVAQIDDPAEQFGPVLNSQPIIKTPPAYLATSAFGRVLEVSPDRTGRIAAFKNLAAAWDVELPESLLGPLCDELQRQGVACLSASSWSKIIRYNRPTIMVLEHKGFEHRVILYKVEANMARVLVGEQTYDLPITELRDRWVDNAMIFWRPSEFGTELLQGGDQAEVLPRIRAGMNQILAMLDLGLLSDSNSTRFSAELTAKTKQLQRRFGLQVDGRIGRETYLLLNELLNKGNVPVLTERG